MDFTAEMIAGCVLQTDEYALFTTPTLEAKWLMTSLSAVDDSYKLFIMTERDNCFRTVDEINMNQPCESSQQET